MLELLIAISYVAWGITLFKIDINHNISGILSVGCFDGAGFNVLFLFYASLSPIVMIAIILNQLKILVGLFTKQITKTNNI
jgi:hypothetical protein